MAIGSAHVGMFGAAELKGASRELAAIGRASEWLNSPRLTPDSLAGKVVLVQFWTYTCINWLRTLPYVRAWADKYRPGSFVVGVHTPEFSFEHDINKVRRAVESMRITYPVVVDNDYAIWRVFDNHYWPALYLVDARGRVRHHHFGEGEHETSERAIRRLLAVPGGGKGERIVESLSLVGRTDPEVGADWGSLKVPRNIRRPQRRAGEFRVLLARWRQVNRRQVYNAVPPRLRLNPVGAFTVNWP